MSCSFGGRITGLDTQRSQDHRSPAGHWTSFGFASGTEQPVLPTVGHFRVSKSVSIWSGERCTVKPLAHCHTRKDAAAGAFRPHGRSGVGRIGLNARGACKARLNAMTAKNHHPVALARGRQNAGYLWRSVDRNLQPLGEMHSLTLGSACLASVAAADFTARVSWPLGNEDSAHKNCRATARS